MNIILLLSYICTAIIVGNKLIRNIITDDNTLLSLISKLVIGIISKTLLVYLFTLITHNLFSSLITLEIIIWSVSYIFNWLFNPLKKFYIEKFEFILFIIFILFSYYVFTHALKSNIDQNIIYTQTNTIFDMGHAISIIRSFSMGDNFPYMSPFSSGEYHKYHFMNYFLVANIEKLGFYITDAFNLVSILCFSSLTYFIYKTSQKLTNGNKVVGLITIFLFLTNSSLSFWKFIEQNGLNNLVRAVNTNSKYTFAGPYDGSIISIFWNLNTFVNQRHLIISLLLFFILFNWLYDYLYSKNINHEKLLIILLGIFTGIMVVWHVMIAFASIYIFTLLLILHRKFKLSIIYLIFLSFSALIFIFNWYGNVKISGSNNSQLFYYFLSGNIFDLAYYWLLNLGLIIIPFVIGIYYIQNKKLNLLIVLLTLLVFANFVKISNDISENHKIMNLLFIFVKIYAAYGIYRLFNKTKIYKLFSLFLLLSISLSGIIDFFVIKNDFQYPINDYKSNNLMNFIVFNTNKNSVFLSYKDMHDPVTFSGRYNFNGFFGNYDYLSRDTLTEDIYASPEKYIKTLKNDYDIRYIILPKYNLPDFYKNIDRDYYIKNFPILYEDEKFFIFGVRSI